MHVFPTIMVWSLSAIFLGAGFVHLIAPRVVREAYARWEFPHGFHRVTGVLELLAGTFLAVPETRVWGVALGSTIMFVAVITLLRHRQYAYAVPGILLMAAFPPALLAAVV